MEWIPYRIIMKGMNRMNREFTDKDIKENKFFAALGYLVFFIPLIWRKNSRLARYCANQGLLIMIVQLLLAILFNILGAIPFLGWLFLLIGRLAGLAMLIVSILCMAQLMTNDRVIELPFIGFIQILPEES